MAEAGVTVDPATAAQSVRRRLAGAVVLGLALLAAILLHGAARGTAARTVAWLLPAAAYGTAALLALRLSFGAPLPGYATAWRLVGMACTGEVLGYLLLLVRDGSLAVRVGPWNTPLLLLAETGFLAFYPCLVAALLTFPPAVRGRQELGRFALDALVVVIGSGAIFWALAAEPGATMAAVRMRPLAVQIAYPVGALLTLFAVSSLALRVVPGHGGQRPLVLLAAAVALRLWVEGVGTSQPVGAALREQLPPLLAVVASLLAAAAVGDALVLRSEGRVPARLERQRESSLVPYAALAAGYFLLVTVAARSSSPVLTGLAVGAAVLTALVVARLLLTLRDNLALEAERAARATEERFQSLVAHGSDVIAVLTREFAVQYASPSTYRRLGLVPAQLRGRAFEQLVHPDDAKALRTFLRGLLARPWGNAVRECRVKGAEGAWLRTEVTATNLLADPNVGGMVLNIRDVTERYVLEARLSHQALHDELAGLGNRALLRTRLEQALRRTGRPGTVTALVLLDLDAFKAVNDTLGHGHGDSLLVAAAQRLRQCARESDTLARMGADEFAVLLDGGRTRTEALEAARRIREAFLLPFTVQGREIPASASVGLAVANPGDASSDVIRHAGVAMYLAKSAGPGRLEIFEPRMLEAVVGRLALQHDLRRALEEPDAPEFLLHYQPILSLETGRPVGCEALVRWEHPAQGRISPTLFVPLAEETGLIIPLGRHILALACRDAVAWGAPALGLHVTVNLSAAQLTDAGLVGEVRGALADSGLPARHLVLELTESAVMQHPERAAQVLGELRALGVRLAIDDFGTGYSSLSYLHQLPMDMLKIDRSFLGALDRGPEGLTLINGITGLARGLNLTAVAEGIETLEQAAALRAAGCPCGQGLLYAPPMPADEVVPWLDEHAG